MNVYLAVAFALIFAVLTAVENRTTFDRTRTVTR